MVSPLYEQLQNPLTRTRDGRDREDLVARFPDLQFCPGQRYLALRPYLARRPERFFDRRAFGMYLEWLKTREAADHEALKKCLSDNGTEVNRALLFLREINSELWHDDPLAPGDEYELVRTIDRHVHPTYLRLVEGVLTPLVRPIAFFSRVDRGKQAIDLDVWNVVDELALGPASYLVSACRIVMRNGIGHGGITFLHDEIRYRDKRANEETVDARDVVRLCDDLLDACNGIAAALKVFFLVGQERGYEAPRELLVEELQEETWTPWWKIEGCVESEIAGKPQLILFARPNSRHYEKVFWSTVQSGILTEFFAPGYERYVFFLRSSKAWPGWAAFDGNRLRALRMGGASDISQFAGILENDLVFYKPTRRIPKFLGKLDNLITSFRIHAPLAVRDVRAQMGIPHIQCRDATIHRNGWRAVLNAQVVLEDLDEALARSLIWKHRRRIVRQAAKAGRRRGRLPARLLPLGYVHVSVFGRDYRRRRLSGFGLGEDLVCTLRLQRIRRIKSPDIMGSTVESRGRWRIAWNRAWLEATAKTLGQPPVQRGGTEPQGHSR